MLNRILSILKESQLLIILISFIVGGMSVFFILNNQLDKFQSQITLRDSLILNYKRSDSTYLQTLKEYSETIEQYVSNCYIVVDDRKVSNQELVGITFNSIQEKAFLKDSISLVQDEIESIKQITKEFLEYANKFDVENLSNLFAEKFDAFFLLENVTRERVISEYSKEKAKSTNNHTFYDISTITVAFTNEGYQVSLPVKYSKNKNDEKQDIIIRLKFDREKKINYIRNYHNRSFDETFDATFN